MTLLAYYGHHKAASTWIHSVLDAVCADTGWKLAYLPEPRHFGGDLPGYVREHGVDVVSFVNADMEHLAGLPAHRAFHVVRDPRDIIVSAYYSHLKTHPTDDFPELVPHRAALQGMDRGDGLMLEIEFSARFIDPMVRWDYGQEHVLELKHEEITADPYRRFLEVFEHLGVLDTSHYAKKDWPGYLLSSALNILHRRSALVPRRKRATIPGERLLGIVYDQRFEKHAGNRKRGQTDTSSHYRSGKSGDWRDHFEPRHVEAFRARYGDLVERLGYPAW